MASYLTNIILNNYFIAMETNNTCMKAFRYFGIIMLCFFFITTQAGTAGCKEQASKKVANSSDTSKAVDYNQSRDEAYNVFNTPSGEKVSADKKLEKDDYEYKTEEITPEMYGAVGDGVLRKLSTKYRTLEQAKKDYPAAKDLNISIDGAAFQKAVDEISSKGGGLISAKKNYAINFPIETKSNVTIDGGNTGRIFNDRSRDRNILQCAFFIGDHHAVGFTPGAGSAKYKLYSVAGKIKAGQNFVQLSNTNDISAFKVGQLIILCSVAKKQAVNENVELPYHISICKVIKIENGTLGFEYPIDEDLNDPQIAANGTFDSFTQIPLAGVENVTIRNFTIDARSWAVRWYGYKCTIENITLVNASELIIGNALAYSTIKNIKGDFSRRCMEIKTGSQNLVIDGITATYKGKFDTKESRSVISIGEYNRNITIKNFKIDMGALAIEDPVVGLHARKALITDGEIYCKNQTGTVIKLFSDDFIPEAKYGCFENKISNVKFYCGNNIRCFVFVGSINEKEIPPTSNIIENCEFGGGTAKTTVLVNSGSKNIIRKSNFNKAKLIKKALSKNDVFESNTLVQ